jgi:hypothetical protein
MITVGLIDGDEVDSTEDGTGVVVGEGSRLGAAVGAAAAEGVEVGGDEGTDVGAEVGVDD